jgi:ABC-type Fe3+/spermidine/putrescine transport system ATPase subunit
MKFLEIININKSFDNTNACSNVNISINEGEFFTLLGPSGCGKTTLLRLIAGFITPDFGEITISAKSIINMPIDKRDVGMVFQNYALFPHMNVFENIEYGLKIKKMKKSEIEKKVLKYIELVNLTGYEKRKIAELSGGEQQRVALARALITEPKVLLLDEPLSNLDAKLKDKMRYELMRIQKKLGITTIFVTHDQQEALTISDRIAVFNKGKCLQVGTPFDIYQNPADLFVATFVGETNTFKKDDFPFITTKNYKENIIVRPQDITMSKTIKDNDTTAYIENILVTGVLIEYTLRVKKHLIKVISLNNEHANNRYLLNEKVSLTLNEDKVNTFEY